MMVRFEIINFVKQRQRETTQTRSERDGKSSAKKIWKKEWKNAKM